MLSFEDPALASQLIGVARALEFHGHLRGELARLHGIFYGQQLNGQQTSQQLLAPWNHFRDGILKHIDDEETVIFPALEILARGETPAMDIAAWLAEFQHEGDEMATITDALRAAARHAGDEEVALLTLLDSLDMHAQAETRMFAAALEMLSREDVPDEVPADAAPAEVLRTTHGVCSVCLKDAPARIEVSDGTVNLVKSCAEHGEERQLLSRSPDYWRDLDSYYFKVNAESWPQRDYIVRMTERCNLQCPICLAKANTEDTPDLDLSGLESLLSERRGIKVDLMAAEPTLRSDLEDWIRRVKETGNIAALHTNGLKLANLEYARKLKEAGVDEVFLQFDGFDDAANTRLRGRPLLKARLAALANLRALDIATSLIVVIGRGLNEAEVSRTYRFALQPENDHIREVFFLGLRVLGSAREALRSGDPGLADMAMMPDELIGLLCEQEPDISREDIRRFNKLYFAMLSAFRVKKCLYVQHYLVARDGGTGRPISELLDLAGLEAAAERYAEQHRIHPHRARARLLAELARHGMNRSAVRMLMDMVRLQNLMRTGMNLSLTPRRFLLLGFITACDPANFDAAVAINCGKGELSADGGFHDSGALANVLREQRFQS